MLAGGLNDYTTNDYLTNDYLTTRLAGRRPRRDSNAQPFAPQANALSIELRGQMSQSLSLVVL